MHSMACSLRWLRAAVGIPFEADVPAVRRASRPDKSREPSWSPMWEVAVVRLMLLIAVRYNRERQHVIRPFAAAAYLTAMASLRQIDARRSPPPTLREVAGKPCFHSVASCSKARKKAAMRPLPWWAPAVSIDPTMSDGEALTGLLEAVGFLPQGLSSMFPALQSGGREVSLQHAEGYLADPGQPASAQRVARGIAYLVTWRPLALTMEEARGVGNRMHGPRHVLPEIARVAGFSPSARDEIGRWKDNKGRLARMSNRYSRDAETVLQSRLRAELAEWIRGRCSKEFSRQPLDQFAADGRRDGVDNYELSRSLVFRAADRE